MLYQTINPIIANLGPFEIRWYGLFYALGFLLVYLFLLYYAKKGRIKNLNTDGVADFIIIEVFAIVIGARIFHILFYDFSYYMQNPLEMLMVWKGGLSFHGSLVFGTLAAWLFCKKKGIKFLQLIDLTIIPAALALCFGRIANFINSELYGIKTNVPWAVQFPGVEGARHPTQLYESLKNLLIFFVLFFIDRHNSAKKRHKLPDGSIFFLFLILYGTIRFFIEFFKDLPVVFLGLKMGQVLCVLMVMAGIIFFVFAKKRR